MNELELEPVLIESPVFGKQVIALVRAIEKTKCLAYGDQSGWKAAIFDVLGNIGRARGFKVLHSPCPGLSTEGCEFLLDLVWYSETGGIELGAECEWGNSEAVLCDFRKLVYVKAPLKVLVYWATRHGDDGKVVRQGIENYLQKYTRHCAGEQYLLLEFGRDKDDRCYQYAVPENGIVGTVSLSRLS